MLREPTAHAGRTYDLTGPEELALAEVAAVLSAVTGRAVLHVPATVEEALGSRACYGAPDWQVEAWVSICTAIAAGVMAGVSPAVPHLAGHPARTLEQVRRPGPDAMGLRSRGRQVRFRG